MHARATGTAKPFGTVRADPVHGVYPYDERASSTRCADIQKIAGFRRSSGVQLPAVPGGHVPPEREVQSEQRKKARKSKKKVRREAWPLRPDLAPFLLLVKLRCFLSLAELCFRWGQPTGEQFRAAACLRHLIHTANEMLTFRF